MKDHIPETHHDLLAKPLIGHLATRRPGGQLQSNPVWFAWDGTFLKISQRGITQKVRNVRHDPHVALSIQDPSQGLRYLEVRGVVDRVEEDDDYQFIDELSERYMGVRPFPYTQPGDTRYTVFIRPAAISAL
jgi:PPOX class probable F420-dependent enzyme